MLNYDYPRALVLTLLGTLLAPVSISASLYLAGLPSHAPIAAIAINMFSLLATGITVGLTLQGFLGMPRIHAARLHLNGLAAIAMIVFLFPLVGGMASLIAQEPLAALYLSFLAVVLNVGGNILVRTLTRRSFTSPDAAAQGLVFGNRNMALLLAILPFDPRLSLFAAVMQGPIYISPFIFSRFKERRGLCNVSSAS
jgi:lysylphosphatidylglycerol synthetase-like protein (DUF2156 family)